MKMMIAGYKEQKVWDDLKPSEKQRIEDACQRTVNKEEDMLQEIWIKLACINLSTTLNLTEEQLMLFLGNWKRTYGMFRRASKKEDEQEWLQKQIAEIFHNGFPQQFIDGMKEA